MSASIRYSSSVGLTTSTPISSYDRQTACVPASTNRFRNRLRNPALLTTVASPSPSSQDTGVTSQRGSRADPRARQSGGVGEIKDVAATMSSDTAADTPTVPETDEEDGGERNDRVESRKEMKRETWSKLRRESKTISAVTRPLPSAHASTRMNSAEKENEPVVRQDASNRPRFFPSPPPLIPSLTPSPPVQVIRAVPSSYASSALENGTCSSEDMEKLSTQGCLPVQHALRRGGMIEILSTERGGGVLLDLRERGEKDVMLISEDGLVILIFSGESYDARGTEAPIRRYSRGQLIPKLEKRYSKCLKFIAGVRARLVLLTFYARYASSRIKIVVLSDAHPATFIVEFMLTPSTHQNIVIDRKSGTVRMDRIEKPMPVVSQFYRLDALLSESCSPRLTLEERKRISWSSTLGGKVDELSRAVAASSKIDGRATVSRKVDAAVSPSTCISRVITSINQAITTPRSVKTRVVSSRCQLPLRVKVDDRRCLKGLGWITRIRDEGDVVVAFEIWYCDGETVLIDILTNEVEMDSKRYEINASLPLRVKSRLAVVETMINLF